MAAKQGTLIKSLPPVKQMYAIDTFCPSLVQASNLPILTLSRFSANLIVLHVYGSKLNHREAQVLVHVSTFQGSILATHFRPTGVYCLVKVQFQLHLKFRARKSCPPPPPRPPPGSPGSCLGDVLHVWVRQDESIPLPRAIALRHVVDVQQEIPRQNASQQLRQC